MRGGEESSGCAVTQSKLWRALQGLPAATCRQMAGAEPCSRECAARAGLLMRAGDATRAGADLSGCGRCGASRRLNLFYFRHTCQVDESVFKVNYLGPVALTKAVVPGMLGISRQQRRAMRRRPALAHRGPVLRGRPPQDGAPREDETGHELRPRDWPADCQRRAALLVASSSARASAF